MGDVIAALRERLGRAGFEVHARGRGLRAERRRWVPGRGVLRLLIPRAVCKVSPRGEAVVRPDGLAILMSVVCVGGVIVERTMDRAVYPRDYPPSFVYGLSAVYLALLLVELVISRRALARALTGAS